MNMRMLVAALLVGGLVVGNTHASLIGSDYADNYDPPAWEDESNEGIGFGAWDMWDDGENSGFFIGSSTADGHGDINSDGVAFGMFANFNQWANAQRSITNWGSGYTFSIDMAVNWRDGGRGLSLFGPDGFAPEDEFWNIHISDAGYGDTGFDFANDIVLSFSITQDGDDLDILITGSSAADEWSDTWSTTLTGEELGGFRLYTGGHDIDGAGERNLYFNNLEIIPEPGTMGLLGLALAGLAFYRRRSF